MHTRHRSPGGIRSNSMGGGGGGGGGLAAARISPDTSLPRTLGYSRSFGGGGGRMMPPPPQPNKPYLNNNPSQPLPPPRRADILMEAGRLATEYLVSQGVLPPSVLADNKWPPNPNLNLNLNGTSSSFQLPDGRPSALARLGNGFPEEGGFRNRTRGRRRMNSSTRGYDSSEWGTTTTTRDNNTRKNGLFYQRPQTHYHPDMEGGGDDDLVPPQWQRDAQQQGDLDASSGVVKAVANDSPLKSDVAGDSESMLTNYEIVDDGGSKTTTSTTEKELNLETDREASNASDEMKILNMGTGDTKDGTSEDGLGKQSDLEDFSMHHLSVESDIMRKDTNGLLRLCDFARVPTKTRSSLSLKGSRVESVPLTETEIENEERNACVVPPPEGPKVSKEEDSSESLSNCMPEGQTRSSKCLDSDIPGPPTTQTVEDVEGLGSALALEKGESTASQYLPGSTVIREQASGEGLAELGRSNSVVKDRGDKRALENDDLREGSKKPKEWPSAIDACTDDYYHLHNFCANPSHSHKSNASEVEVVEIVDEERLFDVSLLPRGASESGIESKEEKQLFPSSFRICDLNLMESSDMSDTHDSGPVYGLPSTMQDKMGVQVDVDLTMSNSCNRSDDYDRSAADAKEAIVVDIEDDSAKEDEDFDTSERKNEIANSSLESFPNHMGNTGDLPDAQDGYGLMISELLGNDIPNCSSVPGDMTSMHTEMGLHNGAEILDDDDPIYLSLGEIPISFLGVWEQPTQPYEKPF